MYKKGNKDASKTNWALLFRGIEGGIAIYKHNTYINYLSGICVNVFAFVNSR